MSANLVLEAGETVDVSLARSPGIRKADTEPSPVTSPGVVVLDGGSRTTSDAWGWITTGASLAMLAAGVWARLDADRLFDAYTRVWKEQNASEQVSQAEIFERYETIIHRETTAWVLVGIGAAGAVAGTILLLGDDGPSTAGTVDYLGSSFTVTPGLDGSVQMQLRF